MKLHVFPLLALATSGIALPLQSPQEEACKGKALGDQCTFNVKLPLAT